jgi:DNA-binding transcriptional ArsR family regulator
MMYESFKLFARVLANRTRFDIVMQLMDGERSVLELCDALGYEQSRVSHNLKCLLNCGFVEVEQRGKRRIYRLNSDIKDLILKIENHIQLYESRLRECGILKEENVVKVVR